MSAKLSQRNVMFQSFPHTLSTEMSYGHCGVSLENADFSSSRICVMLVYTHKRLWVCFWCF